MSEPSDDHVIDGEEQLLERDAHRADPNATEYGEFEAEPVERPTNE
jgi:hypothetical protein